MPRLRLRARITLAMLALALVPLLVVTAVLAQLNLSRLSFGVKEYGLAVADQVLVALDSTIDGATGELKEVGQALAASEVPIDERLRVAQALLLGSRHLHAVTIYDQDGAPVDAMRAKEVALAIEPPATLDEALRERARREGTAFLPAQVLPGAGAVLPLVAAVHRPGDGALFGYLWTGVDLRDLPKQVAATSSRRFGGREDRVFVFDERWTVVAHADPARIGQTLAHRGFLEDFDSPESLLSGQVTYTADYPADGEDLLGVLLGIGRLRWGVLVEQPRAEAYAAVRETLVTALALGAAFLLVALAVGLWMGRGLARPILSVSRAAARVQEGDLATSVDVRSRDEVGDLARMFNQMVRGLREREYIRETFGRYVTPEVAGKLTSDPASLALGGKVQEVTVVMTDLRGFTAMTERVGPEAMVDMLNRYFTRMCDVVLQFQGHISEFVGDGLVLFFGAPDVRPDDPLRAVACAVALQLELRAFAAEVGRPLEMGIGVDTGAVIAGNIGSDRRRKYGVVGDAINLASRLESVTVGTQILVSAATWERVREHVEVGPEQVFHAKGKRDPIHFYELTAVRGAYDLALPAPPEEEWHPFAATLACHAVSGKEVSEEAREAQATRASATHLVWEADWAPEPLTNHKLAVTLADGRRLTDVYVKVTEVAPAAAGRRVTARLTSAPDEARAILARGAAEPT